MTDDDYTPYHLSKMSHWSVINTLTDRERELRRAEVQRRGRENSQEALAARREALAPVRETIAAKPKILNPKLLTQLGAPDVRNQTFFKLTTFDHFEEPSTMPNGKSCTMIKARCECGNVSVYTPSTLMAGRQKQCITCSRAEGTLKAHRKMNGPDWTPPKDDEDRNARYYAQSERREYQKEILDWNRAHPSRRMRSTYKIIKPNELAALLKSQEHRCALTGEPLDQTPCLDHIIPLAKGGSHILSNLQYLSPGASQAKQGKYQHVERDKHGVIQWVAIETSRGKIAVTVVKRRALQDAGMPVPCDLRASS